MLKWFFGWRATVGGLVLLLVGAWVCAFMFIELNRIPIGPVIFPTLGLVMLISGIKNEIKGLSYEQAVIDRKRDVILYGVLQIDLAQSADNSAEITEKWITDWVNENNNFESSNILESRVVKSRNRFLKKPKELVINYKNSLKHSKLNIDEEQQVAALLRKYWLDTGRLQSGEEALHQLI